MTALPPFLLILALLLGGLTTPVFASNSDASFADVLQAERARQRAQQAYDRDQHRMGRAEREDYLDYLQQLEQRVATRCTRKAPDAETIARLQLPCASHDTRVILRAQDRDAEQTQAERSQHVESELDDSFGEFDELLLTEQEKLEHARAHRSGSPGRGGYGDAGQEGEGGNDQGESGEGQSGTQTASGSQGNGSDAEGSDGQEAGGAGSDGKDTDGEGSETTAGQEQGEGKGKGKGQRPGQGQRGAHGGTTQTTQGAGGRGNTPGTPADIPDGRDDDIIARQLREAAETETDPKLRARLWEEYRLYKAGL